VPLDGGGGVSGVRFRLESANPDATLHLAEIEVVETH
jgi:hypothetical protein